MIRINQSERQKDSGQINYDAELFFIRFVF